jgi:hypothetical protein
VLRTARGETVALSAAVIAGAALCYVILILKHPQSGLAPMLFVLPLTFTLVRIGRLRWFGALALSIVTAAAYFAAVLASIQVYSWIGVGPCMFCSPEEAAARTMHAIPWHQLVGAAGGAVGSAIAFLAIALLGPDLRDGKALLTMAIAIPSLALLGAIGFSGALPGAIDPIVDSAEPSASYMQALLMFSLWQLAFGAAFAVLLRRHTPRTKAALS